MAHTRIDRMTRELQAEPSLQFFQWLAALVLPARREAEAAQPARGPIRNPYVTEGVTCGNDEDAIVRKAA